MRIPSALLALASVLTTQGVAGTLTNLYTFKGLTDRSYPWAPVIVSGDTIYGTTSDAENGGYGGIFSVKTNGTGFTNLYTFTATSGISETNSDGALPKSGLLPANGTLYGTTSSGGTKGLGTIFAIKIDGTGFTNLHTFMGYPNDGATPFAGLISMGEFLYGTTSAGGSGGGGTVFAMKTNGTGFTLLYSFSGGSVGGTPYAEVLSVGDVLYGTTATAGIYGYGTIFAVSNNGTGFRVLHQFNVGPGDGNAARCALVLSSNILYGTTSGWDSSGYGTIFAINTNSTGFTNIYTFNGTADGRHPWAGLVLAGDTLYGTAEQGGALGRGTLFSIKRDGTAFSILHSFADSPQDGGDLKAVLTLTNNTLYGTTYNGGSSFMGTVFALPLTTTPPLLALGVSGTNVIVTWPTSATGFSLECVTNLAAPTNWAAVSPGPTVVNGQNVVTNILSGSRKFYRLRQ